MYRKSQSRSLDYFNIRQARYGRQYNGPQRYPSSNYLNFCVLIMLRDKRELRMYMQLKLLIRWPWDGEITLNYLDGPNLITWVLKGRRETDRKEGHRDVMWKRLDLLLFMFQMEEGDTSQWMQVASRSWKR